MIIFFPTGNDAKFYKYAPAMERDRIDYRRYLMVEDETGNPSPVIIDNIPEDGGTPEENARIKAKTYYDKYRSMIPPNTEFAIMTTDEALYFDEWDEKDPRQPGRFVRRWLRGDSERTTDQQLLENGISFVKKYFGETAEAHWLYSMVLYDGTEYHNYEWKEERVFCTTPHYPLKKGYPLDCISIIFSTKDGKPFMLSQLNESEIDECLGKYTADVTSFIKMVTGREELEIF